MKKLLVFLVLFLLLIESMKIYSNPLPVTFISELIADSSNFALEINVNFFSSHTLDGWYLTTLKDTVAMDSGIVLVDSNHTYLYDYFVIKQENLVRPLSIDSTEDIVGIGKYYKNPDSSYYFYTDESLSFGDNEESQIGQPLKTQSICRYEDFSCYLTDSSTLGADNGYEIPLGVLDGYVYDSSGVVQQNYSFAYDYYRRHSRYLSTNITTDNNGYFCVQLQTKKAYFYTIEKSNIVVYLSYRQIYPNDTTTIIINIDNYTSIEKNNDKLPKNITLLQNYPNPFNPVTTIEFKLEKAQQVELTVYDIAGNKIQSVFKGHKSVGKHHFKFDGSGLASGVYFYKLQSATQTQVKKMVLLK